MAHSGHGGGRPRVLALPASTGAARGATSSPNRPASRSPTAPRTASPGLRAAGHGNRLRLASPARATSSTSTPCTSPTPRRTRSTSTRTTSRAARPQSTPSDSSSATPTPARASTACGRPASRTCPTPARSAPRPAAAMASRSSVARSTTRARYADESYINSTGPVDLGDRDKIPDDGWHGEVNNDEDGSGDTLDMKVHAFCDTKHQNVSYRSKTTKVSDGELDGAIVKCRHGRAPDRRRSPLALGATGTASTSPTPTRTRTRGSPASPTGRRPTARRARSPPRRSAWVELN